MSAASHQPSIQFPRRVGLGVLIALAAASLTAAPSTHAADSPAPFDDHQNMMDQLGVRALRHGANPND